MGFVAIIMVVHWGYPTKVEPFNVFRSGTSEGPKRFLGDNGGVHRILISGIIYGLSDSGNYHC